MILLKLEDEVDPRKMQSNKEKFIVIVGNQGQGKSKLLEFLIKDSKGRVLLFNPKNNNFDLNFSSVTNFQLKNYYKNGLHLINRDLKNSFELNDVVNHAEKYEKFHGTLVIDDFTLLSSLNNSNELKNFRNFIAVQRQRFCTVIIVIHSFNYLNNQLSDLITDFFVFKSAGFKRIDKRVNASDIIKKKSFELEKLENYTFYHVNNINNNASEFMKLNL